MGQLNGADPNRILNECRQIDREIDNLEAQQSRIPQLTDAFLNDPGSNSPYKTQLDQQVQGLIEGYRALVQRTKRLKSDKESGSPRNAPQVGKTDRRVRSAMNAFQRAERDSRDKMQDSAARQYRIVRPDASDAEVREAMEDSGGQIFSQTLMQGNRRGEALSVQRNVRERHDAIQKIEQDMIALAGLFTDLDALVVQQEAPVAQIEQRGEEVTEHVAKANTELDGAVKKARAARKKKWICLGIGGKQIFPLIYFDNAQVTLITQHLPWRPLAPFLGSFLIVLF